VWQLVAPSDGGLVLLATTDPGLASLFSTLETADTPPVLLSSEASVVPAFDGICLSDQAMLYLGSPGVPYYDLRSLLQAVKPDAQPSSVLSRSFVLQTPTGHLNEDPRTPLNLSVKALRPESVLVACSGSLLFDLALTRSITADVWDLLLTCRRNGTCKNTILGILAFLSTYLLRRFVLTSNGYACRHFAQFDSFPHAS
jgi:hypothetical protein